MLADSKKISMRQVVYLFLIIVFSPAVRLIPSYGAARAEQAGWLSPIPAMALFALLVLVWHSICKKPSNESLMDIYCSITGKIPGIILSAIHFAWLTLLTALYVRYSSIRLVVSIYPNVSLNIFSISLLAVISYTLRFGLPTLARLGETVHPIIAGAFVILFLMVLPKMKYEFLLPITTRSIFPVLKGSAAMLGIVAYFSFLFILGDRINNKEAVRKTGLQTSAFLLISFIALFIMTIGSFSYSIVARTQLPFLIAVKEISLFKTLEKIESIVVAFWVASDFILISTFTLCALHILKWLFKLTDTKPLITIYLLLLYITSNCLAENLFELKRLSEVFFLPGNIILGFGVPFLVFIIGKIRRKI